MYLSKLYLQNWRSYSDAVFDFKAPSERRSVVLVGAMNGHGKTSFLLSLYLGLFGRFGLRHCEGFTTHDSSQDVKTYRDAITNFRRNTADSSEPTVVDITLTPSWRDSSDEEEVRVVRRWYFSGRNEPKQGTAFEEVDIYVGGRLQKPATTDKDPILLAHERVERNLFEAHVAPAFFFDGEQAQKLIESQGERGLKKAVEVMFGTKVVEELADTMNQYLLRMRQTTGGKRRCSEQQQELDDKLKERDLLNQQIAKKQADLQKLEADKDDKERQRSLLQEELARMGGMNNLTYAQVEADYVRAEKEQVDAEKALGGLVRQVGLALATSRLAPAIQNRLRTEALREDWESLKRGTIDNREKVLAAALPEPDPILGDLSQQTRTALRDRFVEALESIYNPPPTNCAENFLLGHVKGDARSRVLHLLAQAQSLGSLKIKTAAKRARDARDTLEEAKSRKERMQDLPEATQQIRTKLNTINSEIQQDIHSIGAIENELKVLKSSLHELNKRVGEIREQLARLGPEQLRIAVAERVCRALEELQENLQPTTTARLETHVTRHFVNIADRRYRNATVSLAPGQPPQLCFGNGRPAMLLETMSGFERRAFGIAFTLALADITHRRVPLVIDTPIGNADSEHRPRTLKALADFDLDQIIILTHDKEVTPDLVEHIQGQISQKFLVEYQESENLSVVQPDCYFTR
ncbi:MAG: AAA family ATPase [Verrucomicrobiota bacterium]